MNIDTHYLTDVLIKLVNTPSPTGDTARGIDLCKELLCAFDGIAVHHTRKGGLTTKLTRRRKRSEERAEM